MSRALHFFLHIPKTAGTTLNDILRANYPEGTVLDAYDAKGYRRVRELTEADLETLHLVQGHMFVHDFDELLEGQVPILAMTFLRDPVARVLSEYRFLKSWPGQHLYELMNKDNISLEEFVATERPELIHHGKNLMTKSLCGAVKNDTDDAMLERAWKNLSQRFACFGLVERFDESLLLLKLALGLSTIFYEQRNVNPDRQTPVDLSPSTVALIETHNQLDRKLFTRATALLDKRISTLGTPFAKELKTFRMVNERFQRIAAKLMEESTENFKDIQPKD